ncbi:MAG: hypothetical protein ABIR36_05740 [Nitrospiraceae bacterium]
MQAIDQLVQQYGGIDPSDERAVEHFLCVIAPTLPRRTRQAIVEEFFFLTTGLSANLRGHQSKARAQPKKQTMRSSKRKKRTS